MLDYGLCAALASFAKKHTLSLSIKPYKHNCADHLLRILSKAFESSICVGQVKNPSRPHPSSQSSDIASV